ncbi:hypothetical protein [Streptomyces sp. SYSU K21746]
MITYHAIGYHAFLGTLGALVLLRLIPSGTRAHKLLGRALLATLVAVTALIAFSY